MVFPGRDARKGNSQNVIHGRACKLVGSVVKYEIVIGIYFTWTYIWRRKRIGKEKNEWKTI